MIDVKKGFKAYGPGLVCRGKQYAENTTFEESGGELCGSGMMHYCANPLDCLDYYPLIGDDGRLTEFTDVTAEEEPVGDGKKYATKKLHVGVRLDLKGFIKAAFEFLWESTKTDSKANEDNYAQLASSGDYAQLASSGYSAQLASSGDSAKLASSGDCAQLASSGYSAQLASSGDCAKLASSGYSAQLASSGDSAQLASSGDCAKLASSGDSAKLASSGDYAKLASSGEDSVVAGIGFYNIAKAALGNWIVLAEWEFDEDKERHILVCVKSAQVDGKTLKPDVFYKLEGGNFVEVSE